MAAKIRQCFATLCEGEGVKNLGLSIGAGCVTPVKGMRASELVQLADHALYRAKDLGRNRTEAIRATGSIQCGAPGHGRAA